MSLIMQSAKIKCYYFFIKKGKEDALAKELRKEVHYHEVRVNKRSSIF